MATTTPDSIRTPNPTDPYNLVADLAILASDVQSALNRRANTYVGTPAQRAAFTSAPTGTHWQDTQSPYHEWTRVGSAWRMNPVILQGTVTLTPATAGTPVSVRVNFPGGHFSGTPSISLLGHTGVPQNVSLGAASISASGVDAVMVRTTAVATTCSWIAVQSV